ncbi:glutathione-dependent formaldehyde-activating, GFA [Luminiphilus syltensis NOR5-1B]|uniref:Glutathione-dependent formaldehyde-activating, GFA n=1 Tax=Luminiphilus syltensis NOR5-1B TaxID=565045 RepID=B8KVC9_9GAMM|nr:glutathione-dependent formaldehyde-activating, GFA [Luminiphilus syltensis NOR5-1B]
MTISNEPAALYLALGAIEGNPELPAGYHIFVGSKAEWYPITDGLPQFFEEPD